MTCFHATAADKCDVCRRVEELEKEVSRLQGVGNDNGYVALESQRRVEELEAENEKLRVQLSSPSASVMVNLDYWDEIARDIGHSRPDGHNPIVIQRPELRMMLAEIRELRRG